MNFAAKGFALFITLLLVFIGSSASADPEGIITISYLGDSDAKGSLSTDCVKGAESCHVNYTPSAQTLTEHSNPLVGTLQFNALFYQKPDVAGDYGSITVKQGSKSITAPIHIDFDAVNLGDKDSPQARAMISFFHPALISDALKEINGEKDLNDYVIGEKKLSQTMHLFKPESHDLSTQDANLLNSVISEDFLTFNIGDSYSMIMTFDDQNLPSSIYVVDRWRLFRHSLVKTVIGYGDLVGLVLHGVEFVRYGSSLMGFETEGHSHGPAVSSGIKKVILELIGSGFHVAEIVDHTHGVGEFIYGGQKHYHDHDHGIGEHVFGVLHLGHTVYETVTMWSIVHGIQLGLTVASFGYHHIPARVYEYSLIEALQTTATKQAANRRNNS
ncbi:hypothetical protein [Endozoicomonas ascidiicola]|uniref:hypothetical protein n=1 Tax=Endozoicomonas ascidiicola TaxID=1698521 RepID=UPI0008366E2C|nr:hypothetical protein [Endozoicomonas ascidiicola]